MIRLSAYGWNREFRDAFASVAAEGLVPARVIEQQRGVYRVAAEPGVLRAEVAGRLRHHGTGAGSQPAVGDWVAVRLLPGAGGSVIHHVLDRLSKISRKVAGKTTEEQVLAANLDTVFIVTSCNEDFNPRRIERYLTMIWDSGAGPVVLLNKADLVEDDLGLVVRAQAAAQGVAVHAVSAHRDGGLDALAPYLKPARTVALLGSSGVGKSTIVNRLMGDEVQVVRAVRRDDARGRHTTTSRQLFLLPGGALMLDTPGLREIALWLSDSGLEQTFPDVERLAQGCKYDDCSHLAEPGCAVQAALASGELLPERLESYHKLCREQQHLERKIDPEARANEKRRWRAIQKNVRDARKKGWIR